MFDTVPSSPYNMTPPPLRRPQHFIFFVREFDLIGQRELQPLNEAPYDLISTFFNERKAKENARAQAKGGGRGGAGGRGGGGGGGAAPTAMDVEGKE
jgi:hypothetical protein